MWGRQKKKTWLQRFAKGFAKVPSNASVAVVREYLWPNMKAITAVAFLFVLNTAPQLASAQCSVCTRTAQQMGEEPAGKLNAGILYLAVAPLAIVGVVGYRWWKRNGA